MHLHCFSACSSWPTFWILTMVITRPTLTNPFWPAATLSMFTLQPRVGRRNANTCHRHPLDPTADRKRHTLLSARVWPSSELIRSPFPFLLDFDLRETFFRIPSSRVLFFGRLQYRSFLDDSNTVWPSGDFRHNLQIFLCWFIFVTSLQSFRSMIPSSYREVQPQVLVFSVTKLGLLPRRTSKERNQKMTAKGARMSTSFSIRCACLQILQTCAGVNLQNLQTDLPKNGEIALWLTTNLSIDEVLAFRSLLILPSTHFLVY